MLSFWEQQTYTQYDFVVVGAGIMGCSVAFELRRKYPQARIAVLERGPFSTGASTRNAGFACFGSPTEILYDIQLNGTTAALDIVRKRWEGLQILTERLGEDSMGKTPLGGYELIFDQPLPSAVIDSLNELLYPIFKAVVFSDVTPQTRKFGFGEQVQQLLFCTQEAQIDSGKMMLHYVQLLQQLGVMVLNGMQVRQIQDNLLTVYHTELGEFSIRAGKILVCTNAFARELCPETEVLPGRGQVVITNELEDLPFKGSFHFDEGFYYFRNVGKRVLLGGGRNLDFMAETSTAFEPNAKILADLEEKLHTVILPDIPFEIEYSWQGIMGFSGNKLPVVRHINPHTLYVMACNGMGVALSPYVAREAVEQL